MFPGRIVANRYRVLRVLGRGGMGVVSEAESLATGEHFAIKFLREDVESDMEPSARFLREAKLAARLTSSHTCRVTEIGEWELGPFLVMELLQGRSLAAVLEDKLTITWQQCVRIAWEMCDALAEAHARGIVHRDVKASNVFLANLLNGSITTKVLDFGVAKIPKSVVTAYGERSLTDASTMLGTPSYVAPEQLMNSKLVDARADVWSTGVLMYEMLSGRLPFVSQLVPKLLVMIAREQPPPLATVAPDVPSELIQIVHRCLEKEPNCRYEHAGTLATALSPLLEASTDLLQPLLVSRPNKISLGPTLPPPCEETRATPSKARDRDSLNPHTARTPDPKWQKPKRRSRWHFIAAGSGIGAIAALVYLLASGAPAKVNPAGNGSAGAASVASTQSQPQAHQLLILVDPAQSRIELDGTAIGGSPSRISGADDGVNHRLMVSAPGYLTLERLVRFNVDQQLSLFLSPIEAPPFPDPSSVTERQLAAPKRGSPATKSTASNPKPVVPRRLDTDNPF